MCCLLLYFHFGTIIYSTSSNTSYMSAHDLVAATNFVLSVCVFAPVLVSPCRPTRRCVNVCVCVGHMPVRPIRVLPQIVSEQTKH